MNIIKFLFRGLISNDTVIEGKEKKWWLAIVVGVISIIISLIPALVQVSRLDGSTILTSNTNYSFDKGLELFSKHLKDENYTLTIDGQGNLTTSGFTSYTAVYQEKEILRVEYVETTESTIISERIDILAKKNYSNNVNADGKVDNKVTSYMLLSTKMVYVALYELNAENTIDQASQTVTKSAAAKTTFQGNFVELHNVSIHNFFDPAENNYDEAIENWADFFSRSYKPLKNMQFLSSAALMGGLNIIILLVLSVSLMIITRGKANKNVRLSYLDALKICCFAALCPAILSAILGSLIAVIQTIGFVLFLGLRTTWIGMKITRPTK